MRLRHACIAGLLCAAVGVPVAIAATSTPAQHYSNIQQAAQLASSGQYGSAAALYAQLTAEDPDNGALWSAQARAYQNAGDKPNAIAAYKRADEIGFGGPFPSLTVAQLYASLGDKNASLDWLQHALFDQRLSGRTGLATDPAFAAFASDARFKRLTGQPATTLTTRTAKWRFDIDLLVEEAQRLHASLERIEHSPKWLAKAAALRSNISHLTDGELSLALTRLVVDLHDGHANALPVSLDTVQVDLYKFSDGVHIVGGPGVQADTIGAEVLKIGGKPIDALLRKVRAYSPHDNDKQYDWNFRVYLMFPDVLRSFGAMPAADHATFTIRDVSGVVRNIDVGVGPFREPKLAPPAAASEPVPLYLTDTNRNFWIKPLPDLDAVWFQFNQVFFDFGTGKSIAQISNELWDALNNTGANNLIVDVRLNNGGNSVQIPPILKVLEAFERANPQHKVYVVTGRGTFSAAQIFINNVERFTNAVFVGEESSSRPNFSGESGNRFTLPYSKLRVNISFRFHQSSFTDDERQWIPVSIPAELSSEQWLHNQDPVYDAIADVITP